MMEYWNIGKMGLSGSWSLPPSLSCKPYRLEADSERILQYWINGNIRLVDKV
jgi:hypothetical protein